MERIVAASIQMEDGSIFVNALNHGFAVEDARAAGNLGYIVAETFLTSTGRHVDREQGARIARASGQVPCNYPGELIAEGLG